VKQLTKDIAALVGKAIETAQAAGDFATFPLPEIKIELPKREGQGDYAFVAMSLKKQTNINNPRQIADIIVKHLPQADYLEKVDIANPAFINFYLSTEYLKRQVQTIIAEGNDFFTLELGNGKRAQVEFVSANPTGPLTIGRTRGGVIGDTMARLLQAAGYDVQREYYFNNAGNQMMMLGESMKIRYLQALGQDVELPETHYQGDYLIDFGKELVEKEGDKLVNADWKPFKDFAEAKMFEWIKRSLKSIDIEHDAFFNEDSLFKNEEAWEVLSTLKEKGYIYEAIHREGETEDEIAKSKATLPAQWFRSSSLGDTEDRVLVRGDGVPTYTLPDIAYHKNKLERGFDVLVNVLGSDHYVQAQVVRYGITAIGMNPEPIHVILNQMMAVVEVDPVTGEKREKKGSTRRGIYDTLDDLVEWTSADAIRYHLLARSPSTQISFDVNEVVKQSNENPVYYIQNAHVRCCGIFREAEERGFSDEGADLTLLGEDELKFIRKAMELGEVIENCVNTYEPHKIAFFAYDLAATFHPIYDRVRVLHSEVPEDVAKARLRFYKAAQVVFYRVLRLMGMTAPERM
jgi:arginyl-tRNA synthetase